MPQRPLEPRTKRQRLFPTDELLRKHGYRIYGRGKDGPRWERDGIVYNQAEAIDLVDRKEADEGGAT